MISKRLIITEEERKEIKTLYGLIREQEAAQKNPELTLDLAGTFGSGKYLIPGKADKIDDLINQIREFKKQNAGSVIEIQINSGESQVPNYDREKFPDGKDTRPEAKLNVGDLGKKRAVSLEAYLKTNAPDLLEDAKIVKNEPVIGTTKWDTAKGSKHPDYTKEQFANFKIKVIGKKPTMSVLPSSGTTDCATGLRIKVWVPKHNCNNAEFFIVLNNTVLYNVNGGYTANLNNSNTVRTVGGVELKAEMLNPAYGYISTRYGQDRKNGDYGGARIDEFVVTEAQSKTIVSSGKGYIYIWMIGTTGKSAHDDIPQVEITKNTEKIFSGKVNAPSGLLMILDACGNKVLNVPEESQQSMPNVDGWISKLVGERSKLKIKGNIPRKVDSKGEILKSVDSILEKIENLQTSIFNSSDKNQNIINWNNAKTGTTNVVSQTYIEIAQKIKESNLKQKDPKVSGEYVNDVLNGDMYGDVRRRLNKFYEIFNAMYFSKSNNYYLPSGLSGRTVYKSLYGDD